MQRRLLAILFVVLLSSASSLPASLPGNWAEERACGATEEDAAFLQFQSARLTQPVDVTTTQAPDSIPTVDVVVSGEVAPRESYLVTAADAAGDWKTKFEQRAKDTLASAGLITKANANESEVELGWRVGGASADSGWNLADEISKRPQPSITIMAKLKRNNLLDPGLAQYVDGLPGLNAAQRSAVAQNLKRQGIFSRSQMTRASVPATLENISDLDPDTQRVLESQLNAAKVGEVTDADKKVLVDKAIRMAGEAHNAAKQEAAAVASELRQRTQAGLNSVDGAADAALAGIEAKLADLELLAPTLSRTAGAAAAKAAVPSAYATSLAKAMGEDISAEDLLRRNGLFNGVLLSPLATEPMNCAEDERGLVRGGAAQPAGRSISDDLRSNAKQPGADGVRGG